MPPLKSLKRKYEYPGATLIPLTKSPIVAADRPHCVSIPSPFSLEASSQGYQHGKETAGVQNDFRYCGWSTALSQLVICDSLSPTTSPNAYTLSSGTTRLFADIFSNTGVVYIFFLVNIFFLLFKWYNTQ